MPISIRFLFSARPIFQAIKLIRFEPGVQWHYPRPLARQHRLLPHLKKDVLRDE